MKNKASTALTGSLHSFFVIVGAAGLTAGFFLLLPVIQAISKPAEADTIVSEFETKKLPPPPPPPEKEPEKPPEEEKPPPKLNEAPKPMNLSSLDLTLSGGGSGSWMSGSLGSIVNTGVAEEKNVAAMFSLSDLDQKPRAVHQPSPLLNSKLRKKAPGKVYVLFVVNKSGRVEKARVQKSTDTIFERPALAAVRKWKFEPGKRNGQPVQFRMRVPITFPK